MMSKVERILFWSAVLLLGLAFLFPLWRIQIWAPQYPEGLSMIIGLDHVSGNLEQINILNHYIGMKHITPSAIPELRIMPRVLMGLLALGIVAALIGRRWALGAWLAIFTASGLVGLWDFYRWEYDYGHNLSPDAPIQIPGMSYQPPLFGHKTLLNIDAFSYPHAGGIILGIAAGLGFLAFFWPKISRIQFRRTALLTLFSGVLLLGACTAKPVPIQVGTDSCEVCHMVITNVKFGGEVIMKKGRIYKFDSIDCLLSFYSKNLDAIREVLVADFTHPGALIDAKSAQFLSSDKLHAPMGRGIVAATDASALQPIRNETGGSLLKWEALAAG